MQIVTSLKKKRKFYVYTLFLFTLHILQMFNQQVHFYCNIHLKDVVKDVSIQCILNTIVLNIKIIKVLNKSCITSLSDTI